MPLLSVIMGTYNDEKYIKRAIDAILAQSFSDFEFVIINDASPDNSHQIITEYAQKDKRIKYLINEQNLGIVGAANRGLKNATGKYLYWASSDDYVLPKFFEKSLNVLLKNPTIPLSCADVGQYYETEERKVSVKFLPHINSTFIIPPHEIMNIYRKTYMKVPGHTCIIKKEEIEQLGGFNPKLDHFSDFVLYNYIALTKGCIYLPEEFSIMTLLEDEHLVKKRRKNIEQLDLFVSVVKETPSIWEVFYSSTLLAKMIHSRFYTLFLKPKHWDIMIPMMYQKATFFFRKIKNKLISLVRAN